jgi:competence protein ComEC
MHKHRFYFLETGISRILTRVKKNNTGTFDRNPELVATLPPHIAETISEDKVYISEFIIAKIKGFVHRYPGHPEISDEVFKKVHYVLIDPDKILVDNRILGKTKYIFENINPLLLVVIEIRRKETGKTEINTIYTPKIKELKRLEGKLPVFYQSVERAPHPLSFSGQRRRLSGVSTYIRKISDKDIKSILFFILILTLLFLLWAGRLFVYERFHQPLFDDYVGKTIQGKGVVVEEPEEKSFYQEVIVELSDTTHLQKVIVQADFYPRFSYGDEIVVKGKLKIPKDFKTDAGRTFPYQKFLAKDDIYYILSTPTVTLLSKNKGNPLKTYLFSIKNSFISHIQKVLPRPESSLLSGMLIAGKGGLGATLEKDFKEVGLVHIVVLSGYNVTIVAEAFIKLLYFLPRSVAYGFGAIGIILFSIMAGGSSTIIRASIMALIALLGKQTGNVYNALRGLFVAGVCMILWNPMILRYDPSFHLSFMATFALIVFSPKVKSIFDRFGLETFTSSTIGEIICSTLAVQIFLLPYLLYMNGSFALITFPANLLVLSFLPLTMLAGFLATISSYIHLGLSYPFSFVSFVMLRYILRIVEIAKHFSSYGMHL